MHFSVGLLTALIVTLWVSPLWGLLAAVAIGTAKEVYDYSHPANHTADLWDFLATAVGGCFVFLLKV